MKGLLCTILLYCAVPVSLYAQVVDANVCDILANPQSFDGKIVRVKGTVSAGFDEFVLRDAACDQSISAIWLAYPDGTKAKAGPAAFLQLQLGRNNPAAAANPSRSSIKLDKNKDFKQFDSLLSTPYKSGGMCLGCIRYTVTATLTGRLDGVKDAGVVRDSSGKFTSAGGFGNLNLYRARLVLQGISEVSPHEIDYSKVNSITKDDSPRDSGSGDPVAATHPQRVRSARTIQLASKSRGPLLHTAKRARTMGSKLVSASPTKCQRAMGRRATRIRPTVCS